MDPRHEWLVGEAADCRPVGVKWRLHRQIYGRRCAAAKRVDFMALTLEEAGCMCCDAAPQFCMGEERNVVTKAFIDDM